MPPLKRGGAEGGGVPAPYSLKPATQANHYEKCMKNITYPLTISLIIFRWWRVWTTQFLFDSAKVSMPKKGWTQFLWLSVNARNGTSNDLTSSAWSWISASERSFFGSVKSGAFAPPRGINPVHRTIYLTVFHDHLYAAGSAVRHCCIISFTASKLWSICRPTDAWETLSFTLSLYGT